MTDKILSLIPNSALILDPAEFADRVETFAARIRAGEFSGLERLVIILETPTVDFRIYGRPTSNMELVGLLDYVKNKVMNGN
jgi:hypothetical protein